MSAQAEIRVWDPLVRVFHWTLVAAFTLAYTTEGEWMPLHSWAGYLIFGLVVIRLIWGFIGSRYARFSSFVRGPATVMAYLKDMGSGKARRYLGHNPAGAVMIVLLLTSLLFTTVSGMALYGVEEQAGPLAGYVAGFGHDGEELFEEVHEFFANFTLLLVVFHVLGVVLESYRHGESLVRAMFTGRKKSA